MNTRHPLWHQEPALRMKLETGSHGCCGRGQPWPLLPTHGSSISTSCTGWLLPEPEKPELEPHHPLKSGRLLKINIPQLPQSKDPGHPAPFHRHGSAGQGLGDRVQTRLCQERLDQMLPEIPSTPTAEPPRRPCQKPGHRRLVHRDTGILHCPSSLVVRLEGKPVEKRGHSVIVWLYPAETRVPFVARPPLGAENSFQLITGMPRTTLRCSQPSRSALRFLTPRWPWIFPEPTVTQERWQMPHTVGRLVTFVATSGDPQRTKRPIVLSNHSSSQRCSCSRAGRSSVSQPGSVGHTAGCRQSSWGLDQTGGLRGEWEQPGRPGQRKHGPAAETVGLRETHLLTRVSVGRGEPGPWGHMRRQQPGRILLVQPALGQLFHIPFSQQSSHRSGEHGARVYIREGS